MKLPHIFKNKPIIDYLFLITLASLPLWSTGFTGVWNKNDLDFHFYPLQNFINDQLYIWDQFIFTGWDITTTHHLISLDTSFIWATLNLLGLSAGTIERVYYFLILSLMVFGMYYLMKSIFLYNDKYMKRSAALISPTFYVFNPYIIFLLDAGLILQLEVLAFLPFTFAFIFKGLRAAEMQDDWIKYAILAGFSSSFLLSGHHALTFLTCLFLASYFLFCLFLDVLKRAFKKLKMHLKFMLMVSLLTFLFNSWWFIPFIYTTVFTSEVLPSLPQKSYVLKSWYLPAQIQGYATNRLHVFRLQIFFLKDLSFFPNYWNSWTFSFPFIIIGILIYILTLIPIMSRRHDQHVVFFTLLTTISLAFVLSIPPFPAMLIWLIEKSIVFHLISTFDKFYFLLGFGLSILLGVSVAEIGKRLSLARARTFAVSFWTRGFAVSDVLLRRSLTVSVILLILLNSYPMMTLGLDGPLQPMHIPSYYEEAREWINSQEGDFRILPLPYYPLGGEKYLWGPDYYSSSFILHNVFAKTILKEPPLWEQESPQIHLIRELIMNIKRNSTHYASIWLNLFNVKYIMVRDDLLEYYPQEKEWKSLNTTYLKLVLQTWKNLRFVRSFGSLHFYENTNWNVSSIYATRNNYVSYGRPGFYQPFDLVDFYPSKFAVIWSKEALNEKETLEKPSQSIVLSNLTSSQTQILNFDAFQVNNFSIFALNSNLFVDTVDYREGNASLVAICKNATQWSGLHIIPEKELNWDEVIYLSFWFKINSTNFDALEFYLQDRGSSYRLWRFTNLIKEVNVWYKVELPFRIAWPVSSNFPLDYPIDASRITFIRIVVRASEGIAFKIDDMKIGKALPREMISSKFEPWHGILSFRKISPVKYEVQVDAEEPFTLVFLETYALGWEARIVGEDTKLKHIVINFYANGWLVEKTGKYIIIIEYPRQLYYTTGILVSIISGLVLTAYIIKHSAPFYNINHQKLRHILKLRGKPSTS